MLPGHVEASDQRDRDEEHEGVRGDVEASLHNGVVLECCALWVWGRHSPVTRKRTAGREKGDFG